MQKTHRLLAVNDHQPSAFASQKFPDIKYPLRYKTLAQDKLNKKRTVRQLLSMHQFQ